MLASPLHHPSSLPLSIILVLLVLTHWLGRLAELPVQEDMRGFGHDPDYTVEHFQAVAFDASGQPRYRLSADKMVHYMDDDTTTLDQPRFVREADTRPRITARSSRGLISPNGQDVYFLGSVVIEQEAASRQEAATLTTEFLHVVPDANLMRTDKPVVMHQGSSVVTAGGMKADGNRHTLELVGGVRGLYEKHP